MTDDRQRKRQPRHLRDVVSYGESVIEKLHGVSLGAFASDVDLTDLVVHRLQCASESTKHVMAFDPSMTERHPAIPWRNIRDIGNVTRHDHQNVDVEVTWETVTSGKLGALVAVAYAELAELEPGHPEIRRR